MTKYGQKIIGILNIAPYYFLFLAGAGFYSIYTNSYPEFDWWIKYASIMIALSLLSALGIWCEKRWSILTVLLIIVGMTYLQSLLHSSNYLMPAVLCFVVWGLIELLYLNGDGGESNQVLKNDTKDDSAY